MTVSNAFSRPDQLSARCGTRSWPPRRNSATSVPTRPARALARGTTGPSGSCSPTPSRRRSPTTWRPVPRRHRRRTGPDRSRPDPAIDEVGDRVPAGDVAMDGALVYHCDPPRPRSSGCRDASSRWCSSTRTPRPTSRASTSTTAAAPARPRGTWSTSGTGGSASSPPVWSARTASSRPTATGPGVRPGEPDARLARRPRPGRRHPVVLRHGTARTTKPTGPSTTARRRTGSPPSCASPTSWPHGVMLAAADPRPAGARGPVRGRLRRQPAGDPDAPGADHSPPGPAGQGPHRGRRAHGGHRGGETGP